jgi:antitoxin HicB
MAVSRKVSAYLKRPYARIVIPETDGTYRGEILEFPGCIAVGDTSTETLEALEEVAAEWLEAALEREQPIPEPAENAEFSGRLVLRMPKSLHKKAARFAERDGVSLNQFIIMSIAEQTGENRQIQNHVVFDITVTSTYLGTIPSTLTLSPNPATHVFPNEYPVIQRSSASGGMTGPGLPPWIPIREVKQNGRR